MALENSAGINVLNHYGPRDVDAKHGQQQSTKNGVIKSAIWDFNYNDLPVAGTTNLQYQLPANATVVSAKLYVDTAFTSTSGTTDLTVGLQQGNGTEIDNDGLIAAAEATQTAIGTAGNVVTGAGALIGKAIGANAGELVVAPTVSDLTAGAGRVVVEYVYDK
jgi:hypothetical protein